MKTINIVKVFVVVGVFYTLATLISMEFEQHTAMTYFVGGTLSAAVGMTIDDECNMNN